MIHVEDLTRYYGELCAVDHMTFDIRKGEIIGLLGPNGAGKTTTLRMLTGFIRPSSGSIRVRDHRIEEDTLKVKELLGYLPESAPLYRDMLVYDYLNYVAAIRHLDGGLKTSRLRRLGDLCGLNEVMHKPVGELSKGYKQRVGLAHAMMTDPEILILDEPTSGLDPNQIAEIREIIRRIGKEKTVILSTHILSEAEATCDRIIIVNHGKIVADEKTETLRQSSGGQYSVHMVLEKADRSSVERELGVVEGVLSVEFTGDSRDMVEATVLCEGPADCRADLYRRIRQTDWVLMDFHRETRTLETIFRELTREN